MPKKVLLIIAHEGFQPMEYSAPKKVLADAGVTVVTASDASGIATSAHTGERVMVDLTLLEVRAVDYDGIFFIGGQGALDHLDNEDSYRVAREAAASGKLWGAICVSPRILANAGVLKNKIATGWDGDNELAGILAAAGATYQRESVVQDGQLITGSGPAAAEEFGKTILAVLTMVLA
ncbi:MAG: DJ-1/PfpI family protein [Candidatus Magasanikbacteria bacterium]|nr:DJ-1/PfpI family protein [Candidatus Magasanikbacteria bacterium]